MHRIRDYSNGQLERVNENYIFQRQKLRKFSAQNYLKIKETKKYTQKTLGKAMENLPALYLDLTACRQGLRERQPSLEWEDDELQVNHFIRRKLIEGIRGLRSFYLCNVNPTHYDQTKI